MTRRTATRRPFDPVRDFLRSDGTGSLGASPLTITEDLQHWVNDGLMALFFVVVRTLHEEAARD